MKHQCTGKKPKVNDLYSEKLDDSHKPLTVGVDKWNWKIAL